MAGLKFDFKVEGASEASQRLSKIAESLSSEIGNALREVGEMIVSEAQSNAPVDTGYLRDNIQLEGESDTEVTVVSGAEYSAFVEYGTSKMDAQPFFEPAVESARGEIEQRLKDILSRNF